MKLGFEPVIVETNTPDEEGRLVFANNRLVAVLVRLSEQHGRKAGCWYLGMGSTSWTDRLIRFLLT